jgi:uncharacterized membrane protein YdjX (TVP38/TMEM64 family)
VSRQRNAAVTKWALLGISVLALLLMAWLLPLQQAMHRLIEWVDELAWWGPLVFGGVCIVAEMLFLPGILFNIAAGALFGVWMGSLVISLASTITAALAFLLARYLAREQVAKLLRERPKLDAIHAAIGAGGWKILALLRLFPPIPFSLQNYLYGLTSIRFWPYLLTTWLAMLPGTIWYVYIGHMAEVAVSGTRQHTLAEWIMLGGGLIATAAVIVYITRLARQKLREQTAVGVSEESG